MIRNLFEHEFLDDHKNRIIFGRKFCSFRISLAKSVIKSFKRFDVQCDKLTRPSTIYSDPYNKVYKNSKLAINQRDGQKLPINKDIRFDPSGSRISTFEAQTVKSPSLTGHVLQSPVENSVVVFIFQVR